MELKNLLLSSLPQYCETLPSGKKLCFRPIVVSEEKSLMLAKGSGDKLSILKTLENILSNCIQDCKKGDVKKLKLIDLEYLFLQLRAKSIGETEGVTIIRPQTKENINLKINILKDIIINKLHYYIRCYKNKVFLQLLVYKHIRLLKNYIQRMQLHLLL